MQNFEHFLKTFGEIGYVTEAITSIAYVSGLPSALTNEMVLFETGEIGMVSNLLKDTIEIYVFSSNTIRVGTKVSRTDTIFSIPVGKEYLGKTIDPFGNPLDRLLTFDKPQKYRLVDIPPSDIQKRRKITKTFDTGVSIVDMLITLGKGQRELVIGDRKTGKTNFLYQIITTQARQGSICIYAAIGKKRIDIRSAEEAFEKNNIRNQVVIMAATSDDPSAIIYLTPFCAMTLAEFFLEQGNDVVIVLDDMFTHAKFYRELSLLGHRFPGRNSYPADIFYNHARLMERAGNYVHSDKETRSITCLPVVETVQGDLSGYIQTNLMSMTDGHIFFDVGEFNKGRRPAINPFLSVSRVGRQTQTSLKRSVNREIMSFLTLRNRMERFSHFGEEANSTIKDILNAGERLLSFFDQDAHMVIHSDLQLFLYGLLWFGYWNNVERKKMSHDIDQIIQVYQANQVFRKEVNDILNTSSTLNELLKKIGASLNELVKYFEAIPEKNPVK